MLNSLRAKHCTKYKQWNRENQSLWQQHQRDGFLKFVLVEGVLKWGLLSAALFIAMFYAKSGIGMSEVITTCIIWFIAALFYGSCLWRGTDLSYQLAMTNDRKSQVG